MTSEKNESGQQMFIWPLSNSSTTDEMNTSFGPRIDADRWDFHDGIDLPAALSTPVYAMAEGMVFRAGPADRTADGQGFGSTHVLLRVFDSADGEDDLILVYLHLDSIAEGIIQGAQVNRGDLIGTVGQEDATYPHLHFEFRKGAPQQDRSVHPLNYLPYTNTPNFTNLRMDRCNFYQDGGEKRAVRLRFDAPDRREGDLRGIHLKFTGPNIADREFRVDFDDRETVNSDKGDQHAFKNEIAVEGYQKSNLKDEGLVDVQYGVIAKDIGPEYESVVLWSLDVTNANLETAEFSLPQLDPGMEPVNSRVNFEGTDFPPQGWRLHLVAGNVCRPDESAAVRGLLGLLCQDVQSSQGKLFRSGLSYALPAQRGVWRLGAEIRTADLGIKKGRVVHPLAFMSGDTLIAAACLRRTTDDRFVSGVLIQIADGLYRERIDLTEGEIQLNSPIRWELELLRLGTRQTTVVLRLNGNVVSRVNGDTACIEPDTGFVGILHRYKGVNITLHVDQVFLTEEPRF
ncbi:MAG: M23 family metallopeptidase [Pyrinomonadaceae bacterium]